MRTKSWRNILGSKQFAQAKPNKLLLAEKLLAGLPIFFNCGLKSSIKPKMNGRITLE